MNVLDPKTLPEDERIMWDFAAEGDNFGKRCVLTLLRKLRACKSRSPTCTCVHCAEHRAKASTPLARLSDLLTTYPEGSGDNPCAWSSHNHDATVTEAYLRGLKDAAENFGVGPHLLTGKNGTQALCGGPGVCPACIDDHSLAKLSCDNTKGVAQVTCMCKWESGAHPTPGEALMSWFNHTTMEGE